MKCDEGRPSCDRCTSTGRICDGYGVWGGGSFPGNGQDPSPVSAIRDRAVLPAAVLPIIVGSTEEKDHFAWFECRTLKKLRGAFALTFWNSLLLQASESEPAILNAVLTLSSIHRRTAPPTKTKDDSDHQEQFLLQHYNQAIRHLQPHFLNKDRAAVRVALLTCAVFICLEYLRGNFETAQRHLANGLKVLRESNICETFEKAIVLKPLNNSIDDGIIGIFTRLYVQAEVFRQFWRHSGFIFTVSWPAYPSSTFHTLNTAWQELERLLIRLFNLTEQSHLTQYSGPLAQHDLSQDQQAIKTELSQWFRIFNSSKKALLNQDEDGIACRILLVYHTMINIMTDTCLRLNDESVFDAYTEQFLFILEQSEEMRKIRTGDTRPPILSPENVSHIGVDVGWIPTLFYAPEKCRDPYMSMSRSIADIGWIPPLFFTALKCRVHQVRLSAVQLLESTSHREGIFDSRISGCVARRVMEIEEAGFQTTNGAVYTMSGSLGVNYLSPTVLRPACRITEVKVLLPVELSDSVVVFYRRDSEIWEKIRVGLS